VKTKDELLEENRIIHYLMSELNDAADEAAGEWKNWENLVDQERVSRILREIYTGMLVTDGKCTEFESKNYINKQIKEYQKMNTNTIEIGKKYAIKIGKNEVEVLVTEKTANGWKVKTSADKILAINNAKRFIRCLEEPEENRQDIKPKMSMLDAAVEVLKEASRPMSAKEMVIVMAEKELWKSPSGKTPANTLSATILRDVKKENPRFKKAGKGMFVLN
jgi:alpha-galactosidase/6-phospho-beta-glucosidase family protein